MQLRDLTKGTGEWLRGIGPKSDVVISSRIRLARNVIGFPFLTRCSARDRQTLQTRASKAISESDLGLGVEFVDLQPLRDIDRQLLVERHLISKPHAALDGARGVALSKDETLSIMVNEEDHLRIQVLRSGLQLSDAWSQISQIDDQLEQRLQWSFHPRFGYLTACPTNVGTGIRVSVMLHLPALKLTGEIEKVFRAAKELRLACAACTVKAPRRLAISTRFPTRRRSAGPKSSCWSNSSRRWCRGSLSMNSMPAGCC